MEVVVGTDTLCFFFRFYVRELISFDSYHHNPTDPDQQSGDRDSSMPPKSKSKPDSDDEPVSYNHTCFHVYSFHVLLQTADSAHEFMFSNMKLLMSYCH